MWTDLKIGLRTTLRAPGFAAIAIVTLALGIAANTAIFSVVRGVLLRPLPFPDPDRVVGVWTTTPTSPQGSHSAADFLELARDQRVFSALAGYRPNLFAVASEAALSLQFEGAYVTPAFFDVFGVAAERGRTITEAADRNAGGGLVVLSHEAWREIFPGGGEGTDGVGTTIRVNGRSYVVAGVMPRAFAWPEFARIWVLSDTAVPPAPIDNVDGNRDVRYFDAVARLRSGLPDADVRTDLNRLAAEIDTRRAAGAERRGLTVLPLHEQVVAGVRPAILILQAGVGIVLLIACANISSLLIARTTGRAREMAVRAALGAGGGRLIRQLLAESLVLGVAGGALGLLLGSWLLAWLVRLLPSSVPRTDAIALDTGVVMATVGLAIVASVLFGALPALQSARANAASAMREGDTRSQTGRRSAGRSALVVGEVALTLVLLVTAALLGTSLVRLQSVDPGFSAERATVASIAIPQTRYPTNAEQARFYTRLLENLGQRAEFSAAAVSYPGPLNGQSASGTFYIEGREALTGSDRPFAHIASISGDYFEAMGIPIREGRSVREADSADAPGVVVVSETLARRYWPGESAVGKRIKFEPDPAADWITVVGVSGDVRQLGLNEPSPSLAFFPYTQFTLPFTVVTVRSDAPPDTAAAALRAAMAATDADLPMADITTLPAVVAGSMADERFRTFVFTALAAVALVLAVVGLYGLISYTVVQRQREIGIRVALGAAPGQVSRPIVRWGVTLAAAGVGIGLVGSWLATRALSGFLYGISSTDPATFAAAAVLLVGIAALAAWVPSRRASRIDPIVVLRQ
jgi:putative ABC transport system permease protein